MRKTIITFLISIIIFALGATVVNATTTFNTALSYTQNGSNIELTVSLKGFTQGEKGINAIMGTLVYDREIFEEISEENVTPLNNWGSFTFNPKEGTFLLANSKYVANDHDLMKVTLKVKEGVTVDGTAISLKKVSASDSAAKIEPADQTVTITGSITPAPQPAQNTTPAPLVADSTQANSSNIWVILAVIVVVAVLAIVAIEVYNKKRKSNEN